MPYTPLWMFSADSHSTATLPLELDTIGLTPTVDTTNKRTGAQCLAMASADFTKILPALYTDVTFACAYKPMGFTGGTIVQFKETVQTQITCALGADGSLVFSNSNNTFGTLTTPPGILTGSAYNWLEIRVVISNSGTPGGTGGGSITVRVNEVQVANWTSKYTWNGNGGQVGVTQIRVAGTSSTQYIDDLIIGTGGYSNDVKIIEPTLTAGTYAQWTPTGAASNILAVNDAAPDTATYNKSSTAAQKDTFTLGSLGITGTVVAVQVNIDGSTDVGSRSVKALTKRGGTEAASGDIALNTSFAMKTAMFSTAPDGTAWTTATVAGAEIGYSLT